MQKKYTVSLIGVVCAILICITLYFEYCSYQNTKKSKESAITLVSEELSINYLDGNVLNVTEENMQNTFSITNHSGETKYYYIRFSNFKGDITDSTYQITSSNPSFSPVNSTFAEKTTIVKQFAILEGETHRYVLSVSNPKNKKFSFQIEVDNEKVDHSFQNVLLSKNTILEDSDINFEESSVSGLFKKSEQYGDVYYYRGNVENNYVSFAGFLWRIVKINEDGTVKLILDSTTENMMKIREQENGASFDFFNSLVNTHLEEWYNIHLKDFDHYISSRKYCYDDSVIYDELDKVEYLANQRLLIDYRPTNICGGTEVSKKIALLTADEVMFAGGNNNENKNYYLHLDSLQRSWWTMTPNKMENNALLFYVVNADGSLGKDVSEATNLFVRPVITLLKKTKVSGEGSKEAPYEVVVN